MGFLLFIYLFIFAYLDKLSKIQNCTHSFEILHLGEEESCLLNKAIFTKSNFMFCEL